MIDGKKTLIGLLYFFSAVLLVVVVSFSTLWILNRFASPPSTSPGEHPASPISNSFPPAPNFIKLSGVYFDGPYLLKKNNNIDSAAIFLILCLKDKDYAIIYIGETEGGINLSNDACWLDSCKESLYIARFWMSTEEYKIKDRQELRKLLELDNNPSCVLKL